MKYFGMAGVILCLLLIISDKVYAQKIQISSEEIKRIGEKVFQNECAGKDECLLEWNEGEEFMSLGIGHFIWYPEGKVGPFDESFPQFIAYMKTTKQKIPSWLSVKPFPKCPWNSREDFLRNRKDRKAAELRKLLMATKTEQSAFLVKRLDNALPLMLKYTSWWKHDEIKRKFNRVAGTPSGIYALVDYINFKGLGVSRSERYNGKGWGLLQVLSEMNGKEEGTKALAEFVQVAKKILAERVSNAPRDRNEHKWLPGWQKRVESYLDVSKKK